jgi:hypothetical protein
MRSELDHYDVGRRNAPKDEGGFPIRTGVGRNVKMFLKPGTTGTDYTLLKGTGKFFARHVNT